MLLTNFVNLKYQKIYKYFIIRLTIVFDIFIYILGVALAAYGNVIVVTINIRNEILGHFYSGDDESPSNQGPSDLIMALKFIRELMPHNGGDSMMIHLHIISTCT